MVGVWVFWVGELGFVGGGLGCSRLGWVGGVVSLGWALWLGGFGLGSVVGLGFGLGGLLVGLEQHFCLRLRASGLG